MEKIFMAQPPEPSEKPSEKPSPIKLPSPKILPPKKISRSPSLKPRRSLKKIQKITEKTRKKRARPKKSLNISSTYKETMANDDKLLLSVEKDNSVVFKVRRNRTRNRTRDRRRTRQRAIVNKTPSVTLAKCLKNPRKSIRKIESLRTPSMILMAAMNDADSIKKLITIMSKHNNFNNNNEMEKSRKKIDGRRQRRKKVDDNDDKEETIRSLLTRIDNNEKSRKNKTRQKDIHSLSSMIFRKNQRPMSKIFCSDTKQQQQQPQQQQQQQQQRKYSLLMMKRLAKRRATTSSYPRTLIKAIENFLQNHQ
uniref:Probable serine/threonine-protein kinase irlA n=1 Tax=Dermatophagoides pteronyssinus TaxID=6956 RepID=A0A6P6Y9W2_DERPT|nr:probable serine/threonine-protein kinase irlA [Dermatophagoides pteronyssinus]